ncbi:BTAD domain-containing putative transcriptional regulator [Streptomyces sp. NPDC001508]|uniref:BTAD domain-containing putative transcriptional regulator n=1 Tax=Streptomyces sp. NPDC001508 TaxID=3154656 RepID=UPI00332B81FF
MQSQMPAPGEGPAHSGRPIRFRILGPLTVYTDDGRTVPVLGTKQRAVLGLLLLNANDVVATSELMRALWPGKKPATARKMVQNAVSALRTVLAHDAGLGTEAVLLTHAPGYLLRVDPDLIDLHRSRRLAEQGRGEMAAGSAQSAAESLREALGQWNGPVLADVVDLGVSSPAFAAVTDERQYLVEDRIEAELRCGRHYQILGELRLLAEQNPLNERLCGQLMLALYRSGKQTEALATFRRQQALVADRFGGEPAQALYDLSRAILRHDPALGLPTPPAAGLPRTPAPATALVTDLPTPAREHEAHPDPAAPLAPGATPVTDGPHPVADPCAPQYGAGERKRLSAVLVRVDAHSPGAEDDDAEAFECEFRRVSNIVTEEAERYGGTVAGRIGSTLLMLFGLIRTRVDDGLRAAQAGQAVLDRLLRLRPPGGTAFLPRQVWVAVSTGDALVRFAESGSGITPLVVGALLDRCLRQLESAEPGRVRVCDATRRAIALLTGHATDGVDDAPWAAETAQRPMTVPDTNTPLVERDSGLDVLTALLNQAIGTGRPHQFTVLGEPGLGKSRFADEIGRVVRAQYPDAHLLSVRIPAFGQARSLTAFGELVARCAGLLPTDPPEAADGKLAAALHRWTGPYTQVRSRTLGHLRVLAGRPQTHDLRAQEALAACRKILEEAAAERPVVLVLDDLHHADDTLLDFVDSLAESLARVPLLVVTTARPELLGRDLDWGRGRYRPASTLSLEPLGEAAGARLLQALCEEHEVHEVHEVHEGDEEHGTRPGITPGDLARLTGGNPLFITEYASSLAAPANGRGRADGRPDAGHPAVPERVRAVVAEQIDALPGGAKAVLQDASVIGTTLWSGAVAAVGRRHPADTERWLTYLERRHILVRADRSAVPGSVEYAFRSEWVRQVVLQSLLQPAKEQVRHRAGAWRAALVPDGQ